MQHRRQTGSEFVCRGHGFIRHVQTRCHDLRRADVARENDQRVAEIDLAPLSVFEHPFVKDLEEQFEHIGMGLFDLVQQQHTMRVAPHRLRQYTALSVSDIAGR